MSICRDLMNLVIGHAKQNGASRVLAVNIEVGTLRGIVPAHLRYYFDLLKMDTIAESATLNIVSRPGEAICAQCGAHFPLDDGSALCPDCSSAERAVVAGTELRLTTISVE